jgi:hypothetical protein
LRMLDAGQLGGLVADALASHANAAESRVHFSESRGRGDPDRWLESAPGGQVLNDFVSSVDVAGALHALTGVDWTPAGPGSWSYYRSEGHHLGIHRDVAVCDLAVITCVVDEGRSGRSGLLRVWPTRSRATPDELRRSAHGHVDLRVSAGDTVVLLGGLLPHCVLPLAVGHLRIVAPICYQPRALETESRALSQ